MRLEDFFDRAIGAVLEIRYWAFLGALGLLGRLNKPVRLPPIKRLIFHFNFDQQACNYCRGENCGAATDWLITLHQIRGVPSILCALPNTLRSRYDGKDAHDDDYKQDHPDVVPRGLGLRKQSICLSTEKWFAHTSSTRSKMEHKHSIWRPSRRVTCWRSLHTSTEIGK